MLEDRSLEEVGMPLDRREGYVHRLHNFHLKRNSFHNLTFSINQTPNRCGAYPHQNALPSPPLSNWLSLTDGLPLALMLRYMLRSQAPIVLLDR
jgi:hypothetical protein